MRRCSILLVLSAFAVAACGGGSDETADTTPAETAPAETAPAKTTPAETTPAETAPVETTPAETTPAETTPAETAPAETTPAEPASTDAPPETTAADPAEPAGAVAVSLVEWAVDAPIEITAGAVTFDVTNDGSFPHHFAIARGDSYETLPQTGGGAVDEDALGDDFLGRTANLEAGDTETIEFDLEPGNYVFFCNIAGSVSHAAQGQVLSVTAT